MNHRIAARVDRLEDHAYARAVAEARRQGLDLRPRDRAFWNRARQLNRAQPVRPDGRIDIEPVLRQLAREFDLDEDEMVAEAARLVKEGGG